MKIRGTRIAIPVIILVLALLLSSNLLLRLFAVTVLLLLISYLWAVLGARKIKVRFGKLPEYSSVGDRIHETVSVLNDGRLPGLLLKFKEETNIPGYYNLKELNLKPKKSFDWSTEIYCQRRGRYLLGSGIIAAGDPFGLFSKNHKFGERHSLLVYPATVELPFFEVGTPGVLGEGSNGLLIGQSGTNAYGVRDFVNGDSLTHIHWLSTARNGKLMVKTFDGGRASSVSENMFIVLDMEKTVHQGTGDQSTEEYAVTIAASLARKYSDQGLGVGLIVSGNQVLSFSPESGEEHFYRMLESLAMVRADGRTTVDQIISAKLRGVTVDYSVVVVTPATTPLLADAVRQLRSREIPVSVVSLDSESFGGDNGSSDIARHLRWLGAPVYVVRKGDDLCKTLDWRTMP